MPGLLLDKPAGVWRMVATGVPGQQKITAVYANVRVAIVPISSFDEPGSFAYTSTHVVWVPHWILLQKEDEVRTGRRNQDDLSTVAAKVFVVNGVRTISQGIPQAAYYAREKD